MPTPPTGHPPTAKNATSEEQATIDRLFRAAEHSNDPGPIRAGLALIVQLIETRNRRQENGYWDEPGQD